MDKLIRKQTEQQRCIVRFWENTLKAGKDKFTAAYIKNRSDILDRYWSTFESTHMEIMLLDGVTDTDYYKNDQFPLVEESYASARTHLLETLPANTTAVAIRDAKPAIESGTMALMQQMLLPKSELPKFSGDQRDWEGYRDLFTSSVHDIEGVSSSKKFQLLRSSLTDEAARCIAGFETTDAGYQAAWEALTSHYDNKREVLLFHQRAVIRIPVMTKPSAPAIKSMINTV